MPVVPVLAADALWPVVTLVLGPVVPTLLLPPVPPPALYHGSGQQESVHPNVGMGQAQITWPLYLHLQIVPSHSTAYVFWA